METNQNQALSTDSSRTTTDPDRDLKMITDLWGAMIALFGVRWSSQFGETPDASGQWRQTLSGISRQQVADALNSVRTCGRAWPPTAPEFRDLCVFASKVQYPPMEACYVEVQEFVRNGRRDTHNLNQFLYHVVVKNLDFYNFKKLEKEYERVKAFEIAYKATLYQLECGQELISPPPPETLLEQKKPVSTEQPDPNFKISDLLKLFDEPEPVKEIDNTLSKQRLQEAMEKLNG